MLITMLGTGNAVVTKCYNTCFVLTGGGKRLLVDGGGGSGILTQLERAHIDPRTIHEIFVTHKHIDHLLGVIWMIRVQGYLIGAGLIPEGVTIYAHDEVIALLRSLARTLLGPVEVAQLEERFHFVEVTDGETREIMGRPVTFFDIASTKAKQFGFSMELEGGGKLTCCGDEPLSEAGLPYAAGAKWLLHEAFCLEAEQDVFRPYEKHHSTVAHACKLAEALGVQNLLLYHTEDTHYEERRALYTAEGRQYFTGGLYVPEDLETIRL